MSDYFLAMIPGRLPITTFQQIETTRVVTAVPLVPGEQLNQFAISLLKPLPPDQGVGVHACVQKNGSEEMVWQYLGPLTNDKVSDFFRLGPILEDIHPQQFGEYQLLIGLNMQPLEELMKQVPVVVLDNNKIMHSARGIAMDLNRFITSFERVPPNVVDRWYQRFQERHQKEPYFWLQDKV
jgi:hypothetical protein